MSMTKSEPGRKSLAVLLLLFVGLLVPAGAADDKVDWRKKALELNAVTGQDPASGIIINLLDDKKVADTNKLLAAAAELAKDKKKQPFNANATFILARLAHALKQPDLSQKFYQLHIEQATVMESVQKLGTAYAGLIQMLYDNKKFAEAQKVSQQLLELDPAFVEGASEESKENMKESLERLKPRVERLLVLTIAKQGQADDALKMVERMIKRNPDNWLSVELKARVLREVGQLEQSAKTYEDIIERIGKDKRLTKEERDDFVADYRYALSGVYIDLNQVDKAADHLKALVAKEPDNPTFNNDLGFIWADHDMNLEESEKLIRKAIEDDRKQRLKESPDDTKDNPAYLDSLGWVLYKQKKYKEAKPHLLKAVEQKDGQHVEIYDHLADCHLALGEKAEAIAIWKKALESAGEGARDKKRKAIVEKKLKDNQDK